MALRWLGRIGVIVLSLLFAVSGAVPAADRTVRIGLLDYGTPSRSGDARWNALRAQLRDLGYVEGRNVVFDARWGNGHVERLPGLAAELIEGNKVDVVVTATTEATRAATRVSSSVPIVTATGGADPVVLGLAASLARPGGNVTGVISLNSDLTGKRLELVKQLIPRVTRVGVLRDPDNRASTLTARDAATAAKPLGVVVQTFDGGPGALDAAFVAMTRAHVDAVILAVNTPFIADRRRLAELALSHRLPMMAPAREYAEAGALASYGTDYPDLFRRAAGYVDRILRGAKPGDLPIEQPTKFELVINLKTSAALRLTIPPPILGRADELLQ
jgi:putative ABC transport system substrate-binding protein